MEPKQIAAMREIIDHLDAALAVADDISQSLIGALICDCRERAQRMLDEPDRHRD